MRKAGLKDRPISGAQKLDSRRFDRVGSGVSGNLLGINADGMHLQEFSTHQFAKRVAVFSGASGFAA